MAGAEGSPKQAKGNRGKHTSGSVPVLPPQWPTSKEEFIKWFWLGGNGNNLIKELNASGGTHDYIRRESNTSRPVIYCIVLNDGQFPHKDGSIQWKLCKVGFTHCSTQKGDDNRMEQVMAQIKRKYQDKTKPDAGASVIFKLPIGAVDVTPYSQTEERVRNAMGWPLKKDLAKSLGLPCSTEWVLTTQDFIAKVQKEKQTKLKRREDAIDLFKEGNNKFHCSPPPEWVKLEPGTKGKMEVVAFLKIRLQECLL